MGVALPHPLTVTHDIAVKNPKTIFIDHKLLDGERILLKYPTSIFAKKWVWSCPAPQSGQTFLGIFF